MNILIFDDHRVVAEGLKLILKKGLPESKMFYADDELDAYDLLENNRIDVIVLDLNIPNVIIQNFIKEVINKFVSTKILIFTVNPDRIYAKKYLKMGVHGFLNKESTAKEIITAIETVYKNEKYVSQGFLDHLKDEIFSEKPNNPFDSLSKRETEICGYLIRDYSITDISNIFNLHTSTIGTHKAKIYKKLGIEKNYELRALAQQFGIPLHS
jgi:two-component system invasion response regulator UvrY